MVQAAQAQALLPNGLPANGPSNVPAWTRDSEPAGWAELQRTYGSLEAAAYHSNALAVEAQDRVREAAAAINTLQQALAESWAPIVEWARALGVDLNRDQVIPALRQAVSEHLKMRLLLTNPDELANYYLELDALDKQQRGQTQPQPQPQQQAPAQQPSGIAMPQPPTFPGGANAPSQGLSLDNIPAGQPWRAIDQIPPEVWKQTRIVF